MEPSSEAESLCDLGTVKGPIGRFSCVYGRFCAFAGLVKAQHGTGSEVGHLLAGQAKEDSNMKLAVTLIAAGVVGVVVPTFADDAHVGVGVGPVGAGVTVGRSSGL